MRKTTKTLIALSIGLSFAAQAADQRYIIQVDEGHKGLVKALAKKVGGELKVDGNGFIAATFAGKDLSTVKGLLNNPHVTLVEEDQRRLPLALYNDDIGDPSVTQLTPYAVYQSQANQLTFNPSAGMKVCVIDSGLDRSNPDFEWSSITGDNDIGTGNWDENGGPHGTHVAGTIGAADNDIGVVGMAPGVEMHIIKVFNAQGWGYSSDLAHAANLCNAAGANIISMSLGGGGANSTEENAFKTFSSSGGLVVAAAGNDGNNVRSYPAGYTSVMMVGANDADNNIAAFSQFPACSTFSTGRGKKNKTEIIDGSCVEITAGGVSTLSTYPQDMATNSNLDADGQTIASSAMENSGLVTAEPYFMGIAESIDASANGKICLIDRGTISFHDKVKNCEASGGLGAVIVNNVDGMLYGTLGDANITSIPALGTTLADRGVLHAATQMTVKIAASDYGFMSGTSMATPAISGLAALLWSNHSGCTGNDIREALKASAYDAGESGRDNYFGYGIAKAADASAYLDSMGCNTTAPVEQIELSATTSFSKGKDRVSLTWSGASTGRVDVYRNGLIQTTTSNDGSHIDTLRNAYGMYTYSVCDAGTNHCSSNVSVTF
ncbi:peptidase S8 and S53 subtilisin kexin sedolisin [Shewanella halifaxensis HAW-EB4]|uniref:Peptidase S8 and S53 subtilisin kexin sedolisin n=1 Tax=Shewanella halifaxensis (strain HAW-EB4) TaxID=458817 RepID=B0TSG3_SHEHH|nr:S8 family serine peptidase [Shewanella halifaxensis]ABZ76543.1 peptidase S8 and S53 subtilisin kexin sedolisin [Shewanella halifaxensis HAW-EB4]